MVWLGGMDAQLLTIMNDQGHWDRMQENHWYDPTFEFFINKQVIAYVEREIRLNYILISYLWFMD